MTMIAKLLWVDDEIDLLRPHVLFLQSKDYDVATASNGMDAIELCREQSFDLVLLDENMPGLSGLETLQAIKEIHPNIPVVMVTKNEEENLMDQAIGAKIADYLLKPVHPKQILLTLKKNIHQREIVAEAAQTGYRQEFAQLSMQMSDTLSIPDWQELYKKLVHWELELTDTDGAMQEMLLTQKREANQLFARTVKKHYEQWINLPEERPTMSPDVMKKAIFPRLKEGRKVFMIVFDNFRFDQWRIISQELFEDFEIEEDLYCTILPTATQYARNAIFSGLMPQQIKEMYPRLWVEEEEEEGKNNHEAELLQTQLDRFRRRETFAYNKLNDSAAVERFIAQIPQVKSHALNVVVINFIDILSHARTDSRMMRELAATEAAYRSITQSWFRHSSVYELFKVLATLDCDIILTTDHGSIRVDEPSKVVGDKSVNTNLRYKLGKTLSYNAKEVYEVRNPKHIGLPAPNLSTTYIFATGEKFFAYPNNYNHYVQYYRDTFQHGGISLEEMLVPLVRLTPKGR